MLIKRLTLKKILSFKETTVELGPLNVLIGANARGEKQFDRGYHPAASCANGDRKSDSAGRRGTAVALAG
jgi:hypothetical protein